MPCGGVISLVPLFQPAFQIRIVQSAQTRNIPYALRARTVAHDTGDDVRFRHSLLIDRAPDPDEVRYTVTGGARRQTRKIQRQIPCRLGVDISRRAPHVLARERIIARARMEVGELLFDVLRSLPRQRWSGWIAAGPSAVTPVTISNGKVLAARCR